MRMKRAYGVLAVVTLALFFGERVEAQLAKQGTYTVLYGWSGRCQQPCISLKKGMYIHRMSIRGRSSMTPMRDSSMSRRGSALG